MCKYFIKKNFLINLHLAKKLSRRSGDEAALRTCVSRSYFGLFNFLRQFLMQNEVRVCKTPQAHTEVYRCLYNCGVDEVQRVASHLNDLRSQRNSADYDIEGKKFGDPNTAALAFLKAQKAYQSFKDIISRGTNRRRITQGVQEYKRKTNS